MGTRFERFGGYFSSKGGLLYYMKMGGMGLALAGRAQDAPAGTFEEKSAGCIRCRAAELIARISLLSVAVVLCASSALAADWIYVVSDGDNLWDLSEKYLGSATNWHKVQRINQLPDPHQIRPGTRLRIPLDWIESNSVPARVRSLEGEGQIFRRDGTEEALRTGILLHLGDRVQTTRSASVAIEFADQSIVTIEGGSELSLDHLSAYGQTGMVDSRLRLIRGRVESRVTPSSGPGSRFEIHSPSAVSAVRGTQYRMAVDEAREASLVEVTGGVVEVSDRAENSGAGMTVSQGFGTVVAAEKAPLVQRPLLPGPRLIHLPEKLDRLNWPVNWAAVEGAQGYRFQLSGGPGFESTRWQILTSALQVRLPDLPDGTYYIRVRAIDELGLEGIDSVTAIMLDARPQPPVPLQPADGAVFLEQAPGLVWSGSEEASTYRLQIANDASFEEPLLDKQETRVRNFTEERTAQPGIWYWRVASIATDGEQGPFGVVRNFRVKVAPPTPLAETVSGDEEMTITWRSADVEKYRVQIAEDRNFESVVFEEFLNDETLTIEYISDQTRFFRVQAIDADGDAGAWGAVQEIPPLPDKSWKVFLGSVLIMLLIAL